jgi:type VI secretion system protein ImpC
MPTFASPPGSDVTLEASPRDASAREAPDRPRAILLLGDFSGRASRGVCEPDTIGERRPRPVDSEDLDEVLARLSPEISVALTENPSLFRPRALEDFHPDRILAREPAFAELRRAREGLERPETFRDAAGIVRGWGQIGRISGSVRRKTRPPEPWRPPTAFTGPPDLLAQMLESHNRRVTRDSEEFEELDVFVESIVRPHVEPAEEEEKEPLIAEADRVTSIWMRTLLHDPAFQAAEGAWRGLDFLLRRLEPASDIRVFLLDVTKEELAQDLRRGSSVSQSGLHRLLAAPDGGMSGAGAWSVLAGIYGFCPTVEDVALLARLGRVARAAGAPFVAAAAPALFAAESFASPPDPKRWEPSSAGPADEIWKALRQMSESRFLGLAAPGFLLRLPYGAATDPTERFSFEESPGEPPHGDYLWGNPVFLVLARLAGETEIGGLPLHVFEVDGEKRLLPCAETLLPSRVAEAMLDRGIMPVVGFAGRDAVRLLRLQSIADPPAPLATGGR